MGQAFSAELARRSIPFRGLSRATVDYSRFEVLLDFLREHRPSFVLNAAGYIGKPNVDACENAKGETLHGNVVLPLTVTQACAVLDVPWGHLSTGCIYNGARVRESDGADAPWRLEPDLTRPELRRLFAEHPGRFGGYSESDEPNFSFRHPPCSFHNGTKVLAEEAIQEVGRGYIWRLRIPFDEQDSPRNVLTKLQKYPKVHDTINSFSHRGDFARACLDLWTLRAPFGIYNVTNPGGISTRSIVALIQRILKPARPFEFFSGDEEFYRTGVQAPRSTCILDSSKLLAAGVKLRPVEDAFTEALHRWQPAARSSLLA